MTHFSPHHPTPAAAAKTETKQVITLIPCHTLEDFPALLSDADAESLLAAWTVAFHPVLIATTGRLPRYHRADSTPDPLAGQLVLVATACQGKLPTGFAAACQVADGCRAISGGDRREFLDQLNAAFPSWSLEQTRDELHDGSRSIRVDDFYALGYTWLQVQLMTRRLRYTSNLDEIYFDGRVVEAAQSFLAGDAATTSTALHDAFDALAQERDHYFSNDPHLVDLTLLAPSTLGDSLSRTMQQAHQSPDVPVNFLIDCDLANVIANSTSAGAAALRQGITDERVGVAGGGLAANVAIHHQTASSARQAIAKAKQSTDLSLGHRCDVFARAAGPTPGDLATAIAAQNYIGAIPIDFASGEGWASESKLMWNSTSSPIDVLVAKPIDGSRSDSFLTLAVRLGQAIDSGEIATALVVHWPDDVSDAYRDLRRAASWGLALGRFWKIDDFFRTGQRPYHHHRGHWTEGSASWLTMAVAGGATDPLTGAGTTYHSLLDEEASTAIVTLANLVNPIFTAQAAATAPLGLVAIDQNPPSLVASSPSIEAAAESFCARLAGGDSFSPSTASTPRGCVVVNPHAAPIRAALRMDSPPAITESIYGASQGVDGRYDVTVDVPAFGFVSIATAAALPKQSFFRRKTKIASGTSLENEFMQVDLSPKSNGIMGVYSGSGRGNRYSMRLVHVADSAPVDARESQMIGRSLSVTRSDEALGVIEGEGVLVDAAAQVIADFTLRYSLGRGSRWLWVEIDLDPAKSLMLGENPWKSYFAVRSALATEAALIFAPLRDKLHRTDGKRLDSPAGLLIDELSRQTLLFNDGRPSHRQRGDRYLDSLLMVRGETSGPMRFAIGLDCPAPLVALRALAVPPAVIECDIAASTPRSSWLVHSATSDVLVCDLKTESIQPLRISFLVVATRGESRKAKLRFCRNVVTAEIQPEAQPEAMPLGDQAADVKIKAVEFADDKIEIPLAGHEIARVSVQLAT